MMNSRQIISVTRQKWFKSFSVLHVSNKESFDKIVSGKEKAILYFTASWCPPCRQIAPIYDKFSKEHKDIIFAKIDVDEVPEAASFANIRSVPTFQFRSNSKKLVEFSGANEPLLSEGIAKLKAI